MYQLRIHSHRSLRLLVSSPALDRPQEEVAECGAPGHDSRHHRRRRLHLFRAPRYMLPVRSRGSYICLEMLCVRIVSFCHSSSSLPFRPRRQIQSSAIWQLSPNLLDLILNTYTTISLPLSLFSRRLFYFCLPCYFTCLLKLQLDIDRRWRSVHTCRGSTRLDAIPETASPHCLSRLALPWLRHVEHAFACLAPLNAQQQRTSYTLSTVLHFASRIPSASKTTGVRCASEGGGV